MAGKGTLTIKIAGDAGGLSKELDDASGKMTSFGSKMEGVGSKMTRTVTPAAAGMGLAFGKAFSDFDAGADGMRAKTGLTGKALDGLVDSMKNVGGHVTQPLAEVGDALGTLNVKLGLTGKPLEALGTQFLNLSRVTGVDVTKSVESVTDVFNNFGVTADQQPKKLDELFRASQATGIGVDELADKMAAGGVQLRDLGFSFEESAALVGGLAKAGMDASDVMPALSKVMAAAAKDGKDASTVFSDLFSSIKNAPDDTTAASLAMETLGAKAGPKLAAMIREGKLSLDDLKDSIENGTDTINQASKDTLDWGDKLAMLKNRAVGVVGPFGEVGMAVSGVAAGVGPLITGVGKLTNALSGAQGGASKFSSVLGSVPFAGFAAAAAVGLYALNEWSKGKEEARRLTDEFTTALRADSGALGENTKALILQRFEQHNQTDDLARAGVTIKDVTRAVEGDDNARRALIERLKQEGEANSGLLLTLKGLFDQHDVAVVKERDRAAVTREVAGATAYASEAARIYGERLAAIPKVVKTTIEQTFVSRGNDGGAVVRKSRGGSKAGANPILRPSPLSSTVEQDTSYGRITVPRWIPITDKGETWEAGESGHPDTSRPMEKPIAIHMPKPRKGDKLDAEEVYAALREAERRHGRLKIKTTG